MFFLYHRTTRPTGEVLANALGLRHGSHPPSGRQEVLIRWGNRERIALMPELTLNPASAIERATDKLASMIRMRDRGVVVPEFNTAPAMLQGRGTPFLGRSINHTRGQDIILYLQQRDLEVKGYSDFYVEYIQTVREYRARVVGDECVRVSEKVLTNPAEFVPWIRNYETGHTFVSPRTRLNEYQEALAVAAVKAHGLHFGAVDMIVGEDGHTYVLEVNTAPALAPRSAAAMLGGIARLVEEHAGVSLEVNVDALAALSSSDDGDTEDDRDELLDF